LGFKKVHLPSFFERVLAQEKISLGWQGVACSDLLQQFDGAAADGAEFSERLEEGSAALVAVVSAARSNCDVLTERLARREEVAGCKSVDDPVLLQGLESGKAAG
jgi:hypothetical protein